VDIAKTYTLVTIRLKFTVLMKFSTYCLKCIRDKQEIILNSNLSISEDDLYQFTCPNGHLNLVELQAFKFELLFESGICAIKDKYYMESVLSITAAMERFYEFFVKTVQLSQTLPTDLIEESFKLISRQSERQLGAYIILYSSIFKAIPPNLKTTSIEFRNSVVHKGYLPSEKESIKYAEEVYLIVKHAYIKLLCNFNQCVINQQLTIKESRREKYEKLISESKVSIVGIAPTFALTHILDIKLFAEQTFKDCFNAINKNGIYC
jgi:hypothetical protein